MFLIINFILIAFLYLFDCHLNNPLLIISTSSLGWRSRLIHPQVHHKECDLIFFPCLEPYNFNPRTHKECDPPNQRPIPPPIAISIHALTKSATITFVFFIIFNGISIHALTKSATSQAWQSVSWLTISIHALTKSATIALACEFTLSNISIHALTKSATLWS